MTTGPEGHRGRLRERFQRAGLHGFHDHEVLEFLLSYAIPRRDVKPIARALLAEFDQNLSAVLDAPPEKLREVSGIGSTAAALITLMPRLMERYQQDRWKKTTVLSSIKDTTEYLSSFLGTERSEVFFVLALNSRNALIARETVGASAPDFSAGPQRLVAAEQIQRGTVNRAAVFPRLVVETALKHRATAVILAHNHPGGDPQPSNADRQLTRKLKRLLNDLDIAVHDHIIIAGPGNSYSFAEHGELE